jgi:L-iditol 2-dehydrogenase
MQTGAYHHPLIPGHEFAGEVVKSASGAFTIGDRVAVMPIIPCGHCAGCQIGPFHCKNYDFPGSRRDGGYAEFCVVPEANLFKLPPNISSEEGAFIEPISVALHVVRRSGLKAGARALVFGGGAIGILVAQWAGILGASEVVLADIREESLQIARSCGIGRVVNPASGELDTLGEFDNVYEAAGANVALLACIDRTRATGTLTVVGRDTKDTTIPLKSFEKLMRKELKLVGCWGYDNRGEEGLIYESLEAGRFKLAPMITHRIPLRDGAEAIGHMWNKDMFYCKVLLTT